VELKQDQLTTILSEVWYSPKSMMLQFIRNPFLFHSLRTPPHGRTGTELYEQVLLHSSGLRSEIEAWSTKSRTDRHCWKVLQGAVWRCDNTGHKCTACDDQLHPKQTRNY
jgi:hypothetical protein